LLGIAIDSEFHTTEEYENASEEMKANMFKEYVDSMKSAYSYAKEKNLKYVACIPTWYDLLNEEQLENLVKDGCDYIQLMNYEKENMVKAMAKEVELAKKYNKPIESIAELQPTGYNGVTDDITFYNDGVEACIEKFKEIDQTYKYDLLTFSYHYYNPVEELVGNAQDLNTKYNYELQTKDLEANTISIDSAYLECDDEKIYGISLFSNKTNGYVIYFYGIEYGKEYKLVIEDDTYSMEDDKIINYEKSNIRTIYDEIKCSMNAEIPAIEETSNNKKLDNEMNDIGNVILGGEESNNPNKDSSATAKLPDTGLNTLEFTILTGAFVIVAIRAFIKLSIIKTKRDIR